MYFVIIFLGLPFEADCTVTSDCETKLSSCMDNECVCRPERFHNTQNDSCDASK